MSETASLMRRHPLFRNLPAQTLDRIVAGGTSETFRTADTLLRQGDASDFAIVIVEGEIEVLAHTASGPVKLATLSGAALLGEIGVLADLPRTATVRATAPGRLLKIGRDLFRRVADENPMIMHYVVGQLGGQISAFNRAIAVYTNALSALEREEFETDMLDHLNNPSPELANFAATFRKMADQIVLKQRRREEMASATAIQRAMLPDPLPQDKNERAALFASMRPAREVGGDFYDAFFLDPDRIAVTIGDVSGKGVPAALFMAVCQTTIRMALREGGADIGRAISRANGLLEAENKASMFATFFGAVIDLGNGRMRYCNCGHNPPVLQRAGGRLEMLDPNGVALGLLGPAEYEAVEITLRRGDRLLFYTDGVTEAQDSLDRLFGDERLAAAVEKHRSDATRDFVEGIFTEVDTFAEGAPQHDDLTCLALDFRGTT